MPRKASDMNAAAAAAKGEANPLADRDKLVAAMPAVDQPKAAKYGFSVKQTGKRAAKYTIEFPERAEGFIGPKRLEVAADEASPRKRREMLDAAVESSLASSAKSTRAPRPGVADRMRARNDASSDDTLAGSGRTLKDWHVHLQDFHDKISKAHAELGSFVANSDNADFHRRWGNAQLHLQDAQDSINEAKRIQDNWGSPALQQEFGTKTPDAAKAGHLKDAMRMLKSAHATLEHKTLRDEVGAASGVPVSPGDITGILPKHISMAAARVDAFRSPNWKSKPFKEIAFGRVKVRKGSPVYEAITDDELGSGILTAAGKKAGISPRSMQRKVKQAKTGTAKSSRKGRARELAIDPKTGAPYAEGHPKHGKTVVVEGVPGIGKGQAPNSRPEPMGDGRAFSKNARPRGLQPYEDLNAPEEEAPKDTRPVSAVTGKPMPSPEELAAFNKSYRKKQRAAKTPKTTAERKVRAAGKRAAASRGAQRRTPKEGSN